MAKAKTKKSKDEDLSSGPSRPNIFRLLLLEIRGLVIILICCIMGIAIGFGAGSGFLMGQLDNGEPSHWRLTFGVLLRQTLVFQILGGEVKLSKLLTQEGGLLAKEKQKIPGSTAYQNRVIYPVDAAILSNDPSHPNVFAVLREAVIRETGGYVHPDLGILQPAPSGAARGLGMVRDDFQQCQVNCLPGSKKEKLQHKRNETIDKTPPYTQEEVLVKVPLNFQMTRSVALDTLLPIIPAEVQRRASLHELDDAALLVLLLAHERGVGKLSRWLPYIASLPSEPTCGYSAATRPYMMDSIQALKEELGLDVNGWSSELYKAGQYAEKIATGLTKDYGLWLKYPPDVTTHVENIRWALCQVASRATAGSQAHGSLRMIPLMDMINHDANAGGFVELTGEEKLEQGDFLDASETDSGAFVVRSLRHGRRKALKIGQELLVNYNVPHYSALDWFVSLGFVPPERWTQWQKMDAALPRVRRDLPFRVTDEGEESRVHDTRG